MKFYKLSENNLTTKLDCWEKSLKEKLGVIGYEHTVLVYLMLRKSSSCG